MATPVIRPLILNPGNVKPGETATLLVDASDPDSRSVIVKAEVSDSGGNTATATTVLTVGDPLSYRAATDDPKVTVVQDPQNPAMFHLAVSA